MKLKILFASNTLNFALTQLYKQPGPRQSISLLLLGNPGSQKKWHSTTLVWLLVPASHQILFICRPYLHLTLMIPSTTNVYWNGPFFLSMFSIQLKNNFWSLYYRWQNWSFQHGLLWLHFSNFASFPNTLQNPDCKCFITWENFSQLCIISSVSLFFFSFFAVLHPLSTVSRISGGIFITLLLWQNFQVASIQKEVPLRDRIRSLWNILFVRMN